MYRSVGSKQRTNEVIEGGREQTCANIQYISNLNKLVF